MKQHALLANVMGVSFCIVVFWQAAAPLFHPGLFPTIDNIVVVRVEEMAKELSRGQYPVRFVNDLGKGRGYMLFNFYAPLPFYTGAFLYKAGVNLVGAVKRTYLIAFIIAIIGMYFFAKEYFGTIGGAVAAAFFVFSPFFGYDVYWRGGLGEVWAMAFLPLLFWFYYKALRSTNLAIGVVTSFALAAIVLSHNLTSYMMFPFLLFWVFYWRKRIEVSIVDAFFPLVYGMGIAAFFWLPAFFEKSYVWVTYLQTNQSDFFSVFTTDWKTLFFPTFIPMMSNWAYIAFPFISLVLLSLQRKLPEKTRKVVIAASLCSIVGMFLTTDLSKGVWERFYNILYIFQFPWRFWLIATFFSSLLAGYVAVSLGGKNIIRLIIGAGIMILGIVYYDLPNFRPVRYEFVDRYRAEDPCGTTYGFEYLPVWVTSCLKQEPRAFWEIVSGTGRLLPLESNAREYSFSADGDGMKVRIEKYYYPGWEATIDGKQSAIEYDNPHGLIEIVIPKGKHTMVLRMQETPFRSSSNAISVVATIAALLMLVIGFRKGVVKGFS